MPDVSWYNSFDSMLSHPNRTTKELGGSMMTDFIPEEEKTEKPAKKARDGEYPMCCICRQWLTTDSDGFILEHRCPTLDDGLPNLISNVSLI